MDWWQQINFENPDNEVSGIGGDTTPFSTILLQFWQR
jgi:hypothetical protein